MTDWRGCKKSFSIKILFLQEQMCKYHHKNKTSGIKPESIAISLWEWLCYHYGSRLRHLSLHVVSLLICQELAVSQFCARISYLINEKRRQQHPYLTSKLFFLRCKYTGCLPIVLYSIVYLPFFQTFCKTSITSFRSER